VNDAGDRLMGCLVGLAVGDAVGTALEFKPRGTFEPITDMVGGGPFRLEPGQWTDDTSMALCLADSLLECGGFDAEDQMQRYCSWRDEGLWSSQGVCFDIGNTVSLALNHFGETGEAIAGSTKPYSAGNGCIMRLAPVPMFFYPEREQMTLRSAESSTTTHGARECVDSCRFLASVLFRAFEGCAKEEVLFGDRDSFEGKPKVVEIARGSYLKKRGDEISGTGYVIDCLEASLYCFEKTTSYREAVLMAANLGDDADTTAAVCGQIAGAHYGMGGIPEAWVEKLARRDEILDIARRLAIAQPGI